MSPQHIPVPPDFILGDRYMAAKKVAAKPRRYRPKAAGRRVYRKRKAASVEWASASQTLLLSDDAPNQVFRLNQTLNAFDRLSQIASNYQYFRMTKVVARFKPYVDTYQNSTTPGTTASVPYFYWLINKGDVLDTNSFGGLRDAGAVPRRFDDKTITVSWKPSVLLYNANPDTTGAVQPAYGRHLVSPWLATSDNAGTASPVWKANSTEHYGILYGIEQEFVPVGSSLGYSIELTLHCQYKKPLNMPGDGNNLPVITKSLTEKPPKV